MTVHVQLGYHVTFCNASPRDLESTDDEVIALQEWHAAPEQIQRATCQQCLLQCFMLGDSASIALKRMGMKVEVHDVDAELQAEN